MKDVIDAHGLGTAVGAHKSLATFLETVNHGFTHHHIIYVRIRYVVEVTADDAREVGIPHVHCHCMRLACPDNHAKGVVAVDGIDDGIVFHLYAFVHEFSRLMEGAVKSSGLKVHVVYPHLLAVDIDVSPHGTIVGVLKQNALFACDWVSAEYSHVITSYGYIGEIVPVYVRHLFVAADIGVFLNTEHIHILATHLGKHVLCDESRCRTTEHGNVIRCHLKSVFRTVGPEQSRLVDCAYIGYAAQNRDYRYRKNKPVAKNEPIEEHQYVCQDKQWQYIHTHCCRRIAHRRGVSAKQSHNGEDADDKLQDEHHQ